mmetsp:Transcript_26998/g.48527  ORF Transcript_26998/g.48527 Transcript_26998/m.48527 type:complete len:91 (-) Transcript_26998:14-286(-)
MGDNYSKDALRQFKEEVAVMRRTADKGEVKPEYIYSPLLFKKKIHVTSLKTGQQKVVKTPAKRFLYGVSWCHLPRHVICVTGGAYGNANV